MTVHSKLDGHQSRCSNMPCVATQPEAKEQVESTATGPFTDSEAHRLFDATAQRYLGLSGEQFLRMWDAKAFNGLRVRSQALKVAALIPLVRYVRAGKKAR